MLFCADKSKTFCSNQYPPQDVKLLSFQMWANNVFPHQKELTHCLKQSKKKVMKTPFRVFLKFLKSWQNSTTERLCWACIDVQPQQICLIMLAVLYYNSEYWCINLKIPMIRDKTPTLKQFTVTIIRAMCYCLKSDLQSMKQKGKDKVSSSSRELT